MERRADMLPRALVYGGLVRSLRAPMKHRRPSVFLSGKRDRNEKEITNILDRYGIPYVFMPPTAGFDILVLTSPVQLWEVKNSDLKWTLTKAEHDRKSYCKANGINYQVIQSMEDAVDAISKTKG
jgi:hypothetical protein